MTNHVPVLIGISHIEQRINELAEAKEPFELMIDAVHRAKQDAGLTDQISIDSVRVIQGNWPYKNPGRAVAEAIGSANAETVLSPFGGNFVQHMVTLSALDIQNGSKEIIAITGAECGNTEAKAAKAKKDLGWADLPGEPDRRIGLEKDMRHEAEIAVRLGRPIAVYPIMELALRHEMGLGVEEHLEHISELWSGFSRVASENPNAWIKEFKTAEEIRTPSDINRPVSFPYPKFMNSNNNVDQAAALILCSEEKARSLGVSEEKWIYPWAGTNANDHYYLSNRDNWYSSPAIRLAGNRCMEMVDLEPIDLDMVDVYSCFPVAVQVAARELRLDMSKPLTVTGGLTWAGGPLNNYVMHSIVRMAELLREKPGEKGLITANGGYITKHAFGIYSTEPPSKPFAHEDLQAEVDKTFKRDVVLEHSGEAHVESYTVAYGPGEQKAFVAARLPDGRRAWGVSKEPEIMEEMTKQDFCGREVRLSDHVAYF